MKWSKISLGPLQTNGFIVYNPETGNGLMIDPGGDPEILFKKLKKKEIKIIAVLLTHAHFDHIGAVDEVREKFKCPLYIHHLEEKWLSDPLLNGSEGSFKGIEPIICKAPDYTFTSEGKKRIGEFEFELFETPGHSPGSVSYYFKEEKIVFSGDVLFRGGIGRTDLYQGDEGTLLHSIEEKLLSLPEDTMVANGHGSETTIKLEKETNPFLNGFNW